MRDTVMVSQSLCLFVEMTGKSRADSKSLCWEATALITKNDHMTEVFQTIGLTSSSISSSANMWHYYWLFSMSFVYLKIRMKKTFAFCFVHARCYCFIIVYHLKCPNVIEMRMHVQPQVGT